MAEIMDELLRYGLFFGAIFQLVCIAAVVFIPPKEEGRVSKSIIMELEYFNIISYVQYLTDLLLQSFCLSSCKIVDMPNL